MPVGYYEQADQLKAIRADGFRLRYIAPDSSIDTLSDEQALTDGEGDGWTLFLDRLERWA